MAYVNGARYYAETEFGRVADALEGLTVDQWEFVSRTIMARGAYPGTPPEVIERRAAAMREAWTPETLLSFRAANRAIDVTAELPKVRAETLVVHVIERPQVIAYAREVASQIPNARLLTGHAAWNGFDDATAGQILRFFGVEDRQSPPPTPTPTTSGVRAVLFTDLVGHTEMMGRLGDARGRDVLREHERITRETLRTHGGDEVKTMGDGFMASFGSVTTAMECAVALQRAFATHAGEPLAVRVGLNAGEPIAEDGDLFGATVIVASRVCAQADAGEILVPEPVRHLLAGKGFVFADRGEFVPKGFEDAMRLFEVRWRE
jgi:class 3 adenylate cyclase